MKFIAILKDSFREAVDAKVMYVMVGLSSLLILLLLSLSFQPTSGKSLMEALTLSLNGAMYEAEGGDPTRRRPINIADGRPILYLMEAYEPTNGDGPNSSFRVTVGGRCATKESAAKLREAPAATIDFIRKHFGASLGAERDFHVVDVTDVQVAPAGKEGTRDPNTVAFVLDVKPTETTARLWPHDLTMFFGLVPLRLNQPLPLGVTVFLIQDIIVNTVGAWVALLLSVIVTAFFIPNMLRKGTVDLLLVKPMSRSSLLLSKYMGGLVFIFLNAVVAIGGVWFALGLRTGIWAPSFLLYILVLTSFFAILYSVSTLFSVLTQSPVVVILLTVMVWIGLSVVGKAYTAFEEERVAEERRNVPMAERWESTWYVQAINALHFVLPRPKDMDYLSSRLLARDVLTGNKVATEEVDKSRVNWAESVTVSVLFVALMLGLSCWWFATRDY